MKQSILAALIAIFLLLPAVAMAGVQTSTSYTINGGSIVSGGGNAADVSGVNTFGSAIGQGVFMPADGVSSLAYKAQVRDLGMLKKLPNGDVNNDGKVDIADALRILQIAVGIITPTAADLANGDVAPLVGGRPATTPKGSITVGDAVVVLQLAMGIVTW